MSEIRALLLAEGKGTRLRPMTEGCPKCLVPIAGRPLLEYWLCSLYRCNISTVWVNLHHQWQMVHGFLSRDCFAGWVNELYEDKLLGTAGTLGASAREFSDSTTFLAHADNWLQSDLSKFLDFHIHHRPAGTVMTMMTFRTTTPESCGIVEIDDKKVVIDFHEKIDGFQGNLANGAVYLLEPEVVQWVAQRSKVTDFSSQVIPQFVGRIATWENKGIHRDIGTLSSLLAAQADPYPEPCWPQDDAWMLSYARHPVHKALANSTAPTQ